MTSSRPLPLLCCVVLATSLATAPMGAQAAPAGPTTSTPSSATPKPRPPNAPSTTPAPQGAPESGTPKNGAPKSGAPKNGAPESGAPKHGAPERGAPEGGAPESGATKNGAPEDGAPESSAPGEAPESGAPEGELGPTTDEPEAQPDAPSASRVRAEALFKEATAAYELGHYERAARLFEEVWQLEPVPELLYNLGQAHWRWFDIDPNIDHLRKARSFFQNYDKRMQGREEYFSSEVNAFVMALNTLISAEEQKKAERERPVVMGPSLSELEDSERRRLRRDQNLMLAKRLNASGIAMIVAGAVAVAVGVGGVIARTANKLILDNTSGNDDPSLPSPVTEEDDRQRREAFHTGGQVAFGGFVAGAVFLPIGIGLRVTGAVIERRELGSSRSRKRSPSEVPTAAPRPPVEAFWRSGALLTIEF